MQVPVSISIIVRKNSKTESQEESPLICPYCRFEMQPGLIEADGTRAITWTADKESGKFEQLKSRLLDHYDQALCGDAFVGRAKLKAHKCARCLKIVIEVKE